MIKKKKKKSSSSNHSAAIASLRRKHKEMVNRGEGKGGENVFDELIYGKNYRRILPTDTEYFFVEAKMHFRQGPEGDKTIRCIGEDTCPVCKQCRKEVARVNAKYPRGSEKGKKAWREVMNKFGVVSRYLVNTINVGKDGDKSKVLVTALGAQVMKDLLAVYTDEQAPCDFTDPDTGNTIIITKDGDPKKPRFNKYSARVSTESKPLANWIRLKKRLNDLEQAAGKILSAAQIRALMEGVEDDSDEDEEESEFEEKTTKRKARFEKKRRDADEDDDDEDEDDDDTDDEASDDDDDEASDYGDDDVDEDVDDEDDEPPVKRRLREKAGHAKKKRRAA